MSVRTAFGLALRQLALAVFGNSDFHGAAISLSGVVLGADIADNLLLATDGVRALEPTAQDAPAALLAAALRIADNVFVCSDSAVGLDGLVGHMLDTRITGNQVLGTHGAGLSATGLALAGASLRVSGNNLDVHGPGIRCASGGAWIGENKLHATRDGDRVLAGAGITLATGLDKGGLDQAQLLANQIDGFPDAGIAVETPVQDLVAKLNIIGQCGNGIVMAGTAGAASVSIENNHLREIGLGAATVSTIGIGVTRAEAATIAGNTLRQIGTAAGDSKQLVAGIAALSVLRPRVGGNEVTELGPLQDFGGTAAGIAIRAPYRQAEVHHNHVERDAQFNSAQSGTAWFALQIDEPLAGANAAVSRLGSYTALRVDERRTLVLAGGKAFVDTVDAAAGIDPTTGAAVALPGANASVLGNVFVARGRTPAVDVTASGDVLFNDNRCELRAAGGTAVLLDTPVAVVSANRVRGGETSITVPDPKALVTAIGNITTRPIAAPLKAEMLPLNLIG